ncbi:hypothetical protein SDC9_103594 [bioreactor metagenome]|uniref:Uncharacterized protein n=1 Tax=bioreactor metagenome TaxID=1076179 RepID=A0A645AUL5_9ZZZZ|nr:hypothetical protein [Oscillospiraceae bacterium]
MYIDYAYYISNGGTVDNAAFVSLNYRAQRELDRQTSRRISRMETVPECVKLLMIELVNLEAAAGMQALISSPAAASFSNDGMSESYAEPLTADTAAKYRCKLMTTYLEGECDDNGIPLLYRGVDTDVP